MKLNKENKNDAKGREQNMGPKDPIKNLEWRKNLSKSKIGKHMDQETKNKISATLREMNKITPTNHKHFLGRKHTDAAKVKQSISKLREKNPNWAGDNPIHKHDTGNLRAERWFPKIPGREKHHIDGNALNNDPSNIMYVTRREHMQLDGRLKNLTHNHQGDKSIVI